MPSAMGTGTPVNEIGLLPAVLETGRRWNAAQGSRKDLVNKPEGPMASASWGRQSRRVAEASAGNV